MSRLFLLIAIAAVVYMLLKSLRKSAAPQARSDVEDMVRCAHCGVHFPKSEGIFDGGQFFCGMEHREAHRK